MKRDDSLEEFFIRFDELESRRSSFAPFDTRLERYQRDRYSVVGRPKEGSTDGKYHAASTGFSVVYLKCMPGKAIGMHAHDSPEVFIPMSGKWRITMEGGRETTAHPWDVLSVPPNMMHGAENISDQPAFIMTINPGHAGVPIRFDPAILQELRERGEAVTDVEIPGETTPAAAHKKTT